MKITIEFNVTLDLNTDEEVDHTDVILEARAFKRDFINYMQKKAVDSWDNSQNGILWVKISE